MRISDWSSDVCSSDLSPRRPERSAQHPCRNLPPRIDQQRDRDDPDERGEDRREIAEHPLQVAPVQAKLIEAADSEAEQRDREGGHGLAAAREQQDRTEHRPPDAERPDDVRPERKAMKLREQCRREGSTKERTGG